MPHTEAKLVENIQHVLSLSDVDGSYPSPIDLNIRHKVDIELPDLEWNHYEETAHKMKVTNSGHTVVLSAKWKENKPFITSGPLPDKYIFSQMHFHWGSNDNEGSEHTIEGFCFPMEMHVVHFKASYSTRKNAHQRKDGLVVTVYLFQIQEIDNRNLSSLIDALPSVCVPNSSTSIMPSSLEDYAPPFSNNYFLYWGSVNTVTCSHEILWFVCREPVGISRKQLHYFRELKGPDHQPMANTFKGVQSLQNRSLFLVNGESPLDNTLKPLHLPPSSQIVRKVSHITDFWPFIKKVSCTNLQSPIDILSQKAIERVFPPLTFTDLWEKGGKAYMKNVGHTVAVTLRGRLPLLEGGPLRGSYKFMQLHFHWSDDDKAGSEHSVDGISYSMESHAVHIHMKCEDMNQAVQCENGIAVVGNFLQVTKDDNNDLLAITNNLKKVIKTNSEAEISADCFQWLQNNSENEYYTYPGSLTTPPKSKTVTWIVFPNPIHISHSQVKCFRQLTNEEDHSIGMNCRNIQKLNDRDIYLAVIDKDMNCSANVLNSTDAIKSSWHKAWISFSSDISLHLCHVVYRTSQCVAWLMMPLFFKFIKARTLIVPAKLKLAFFSNVGYCRSYFFICGILFMYFIVSPGVQINNPNFKIFTSSVNNMWGILLFVLFVGCTLAKVPRSLWNIIKCAAILHHKKYCVSKCFHPQFFSLEPSHLSSCNSKTLKIVSDWNKEHVNCHTLLKNNLRCVSSKRTLPSQNEIVGALQRYPYTEMHIRRSADEIQALENHCKQIANNYHHQCSLQQNLPGRIHEIEFWPFIQISSCSELQSPINIWTQLVTRKHFAPLVFTDFMKDQGQAFLYNTNQTAAVMLKGRTPLLEGGPLRGSYKFVQLHFHWSTDDYAGSEHTLDGKPFSMECHAVHIHIRCEDVTDALECENGIAVIGNFLQVSDIENKDFLPISDNLKKICKYESVTEISSNCFSWLKHNRQYGYYTYPGSLTTPLKSKTVTWILYPNPIAVSASQILGFRKLLDSKALHIHRNCRNVQNLNNREIFFAV